ncbi:MAG: C39 family peptidase [Candidatus Margulisiibacteriota bacterium]
MLQVLCSVICVLLLYLPAWAADGPPQKVELEVPFLCQAPFGNWAQPWQDACEEAAIVIALHYVKAYPLDKEAGNQEILGLVKFQEKKYGGHHDLTAKQTAKLMADYYKFKNYEVVYKFNVEDIKRELGTGNLVLAPMAGRLLGNKYYRQPGPAYHFLVFKGYDETTGEFITNDPGTKRGDGYRYKYAVAYNAIHDWAGSKDNITTGRKVMIVVRK